MVAEKSSRRITDRLSVCTLYFTPHQHSLVGLFDAPCFRATLITDDVKCSGIMFGLHIDIFSLEWSIDTFPNLLFNWPDTEVSFGTGPGFVAVFTLLTVLF